MASSAPDRKVRYEGAACLNVRSITDTIHIFSTPASAAKSLTRAELATVLWFVETAVMSSGIYFDGTVPRSTLDEAVSAVQRFQHEYQMWDHFSAAPIIPGSEHETLRHSTKAARESLLLLKDFELFPEADKAVPSGNVQTFVKVLADEHSEVGLEARALELVTDAFQGSKLLAGVLNAGPEALAAVRQAFARYPDRAEVVMGGLINRFRLNYLNELASSVKGAYLPNLQFEPISLQHVRLFKDYLLRAVVEQVGAGDVSNILVENFRQDEPLAPIGLYALMLTKTAGRPAAILETAYERFGDLYGLQKRLAKATKEGLGLRDPAALRESLERIDERFKEHFREIELEVEGIKKISGPRKAAVYVIPAILSAAAGAALGDVTGVVYKVLLSAGSSIAIKHLGELLLTVGVNSYISEYKTLKWDIRNEPELKKPLSRLADQVQHVFGRPLA
jgi:hypothetical protein